MKLDKKNTVLIGFAFLSICAFWQMYDNLVPLMLTNTFHMNEVFSGAIMAADNVLALFLLPLFGALSDKCRSPLGRRRPFILFGSLAAIVLMMALPVLNDSYRAAPSAGKMVAFVVVLGALLVAMGTYRAPAVALMPDVTPKPLRSKANAVINLMGAVGGIIYLLLTTFLYTDKSADASYLPLFAIVAGHYAAGADRADDPGQRAEAGGPSAGLREAASGGGPGCGDPRRGEAACRREKKPGLPALLHCPVVCGL